MNLTRIVAKPLVLTLRDAANNGTFELAQDCEIRQTLEGEGVLVWQIRKGFVTDMRSGSAAINPIIPKFTGNEIYNAAVLAHDCAYTGIDNPDGIDDDHGISRKMADELLRQGMILSGVVGSFRACMAYNAVRLFGGSHWDAPADGDYAKNPELLKFEWRDK
jgi:hypothetical protein